MLLRNLFFGLLALTSYLEMITAFTTPYYLNSTFPTPTTSTTPSTTIGLPENLSDIIIVPDEGEVPSQVDAGQETSSSAPTQASPSSVSSHPINEPLQSLPVDDDKLPNEEDSMGNDDLPIPDSDPDPPTPKLVVPPGSSGDPSELQDEVPPGPEPDQAFDDGTPGEDGSMMVPIIDAEEVLIDDSGIPIELLPDVDPAGQELGIGTDGAFVLLPAEDSDPSTEESFSNIQSLGPDQTFGATHTLPGRVTTLSSGLGVVLPGSTLAPVDPFLPALTGSTTVINSQTFVVVASPTTIPLVAPSRPSPTSTITHSVPGHIASISGALNVIIPGPSTVPINSLLPALQGSTTIMASKTFVIISQATTLAISVPNPTSVDQVNSHLPGRTTMISGTLNVVIPVSTRISANENLSGLTGKTTVIGTQTFVDVLRPTTVPVNVLSASPIQPTSAPGDTVPDVPFDNSPESGGFRTHIGRWDLVVFLLGVTLMVGIW